MQQFTFQPTFPRRLTRSSSKATTLSAPTVRLEQSAPNTSPIKRTCESPSTTTASPPPKKKKRTTSGYAPPSKYASQPNLLTDCMGPNLLVLFIGLNPGLRTASTGHAYAHPSNLFWKLLYSSGCTPRRCFPHEDHDLPALYHLGNTNIVTRQTQNASELGREEMDAGVEVLAEKIRTWRPESVALVGKSIWESVWRVRKGRGIKKGEFRYGWQEGEWENARVFVATSTSGLAVGMSLDEKEEVWRGLGEWVVRRRKERRVEAGEKEREDDEGEGMLEMLRVENEELKEKVRKLERDLERALELIRSIGGRDGG